MPHPKPQRLTSLQWRVLRMVARGVTDRDTLTRRLDTTPSAVSRAAGTLADRGYLTPDGGYAWAITAAGHTRLGHATDGT